MRMSIFKLFGLGVALALVALAAGHSGLVGLAQATCTVTVAAGSSIQAAINNAAAGAVICVEAGEYFENLTISNKQELTLQGAGRDVVTLDGSAGVAAQVPAILIQTSQKITIKGFQIVKSRRAVQSMGSTGVVLADNRFDNNLRQSVLILQQSEATLTGNLIQNTQADRDGEMGQGVSLGDTSQIVLKENTISDSALQGVILQTSAQATIDGNTITRNGEEGIQLLHSSKAQIINNQITGNKPNAKGQWGIGIDVENYAQATIQKNMISNNSSQGVYLSGNSNATLDGNTITGNLNQGIALFNSAQATITNNQITDNKPGNGGSGQGIGVYMASRATTPTMPSRATSLTVSS